ncbi:MAG: insulinase family protein, partial [Merdibacter sp.]
MELTQGVKFRVLPSVKFKDIGIYIRFIHPLTPQFATKCSLMALMMTDRCEAYPTKQAMSRRSDELYGLSLGTQTVGYGAAQVMEMRARMIHPRFAHSASFLEEGIRFLRELIFAPLFSEENLEEAKRVLRMKIERMQDDAAQYVIHRGLKEAGKGHPLAVSSLGEIEELEGLTLEDMRQTHQALLERSGIEILVCGNLQEAQVGPLFRQYFSFVPREAAADTHYV